GVRADTQMGAIMSGVPRCDYRWYRRAAVIFVTVTHIGSVGIMNAQSRIRPPAQPQIEPHMKSPPTIQLPTEGDMPSLEGATGWLNSEPLTPAGLRGKVVLVQVWTLSCINWLRTLPYVRTWADKYKDKGLVVIGVHSPEFGFEKNA